MKKNISTFLKIAFVTFALMMLATICSGQNNYGPILVIKHGTSFFSLCGGTCYYETCYDSMKIVVFTKSIPDSMKYENIEPGKMIDKYDTTGITKEKWSQMTNSINLDSLFKLPVSIGCPDCIDQGAEWVEVQCANATHKVMFDYGVRPILFIRLLALAEAK